MFSQTLFVRCVALDRITLDFGCCLSGSCLGLKGIPGNMIPPLEHEEKRKLKSKESRNTEFREFSTRQKEIKEIFLGQDHTCPSMWEGREIGSPTHQRQKSPQVRGANPSQPRHPSKMS